MRPSWSASIVFNLVTIPVIAYKAIAEKKGLNLSMIHRKDGGKITTVKKCKICGEELFSKDIVKAYNLSNNTYVPIEKEELEEIKKKAESKVIGYFILFNSKIWVWKAFFFVYGSVKTI